MKRADKVTKAKYTRFIVLMYVNFLLAYKVLIRFSIRTERRRKNDMMPVTLAMNFRD